MVRLLSPLNTPEGREVSLLKNKDQIIIEGRRFVERMRETSRRDY